ncbi:agamous-like MADS-box protein AGL62 [Nicotiana tabacum]|uniref:Agamous-like MADS-box protein AGL62 n=1 Tax=Nicotiana tabacum TaxID=4097 RepID=A0AC58U564_TOBAC
MADPDDNFSAVAKKPSIGRQKIKNVKIEVKNHLQVTFLKCRSGLFKKASELCTLCDVEIAIIVFSPVRKVFSFGHLNVESIIDRFLSRNHNPISNSSLHLIEAHRNASVHELNLQLTQILAELEVEKKRGESLDEMRKTNQSQYWWEAPISKLALHELEQLKDSIEVLKKNVTNQASKFMVETTANSSSYFGVNGNGIFDSYDIKPARNLVASNNLYNHNFCFDSDGLF